MREKELLDALETASRLKKNTRHCWTDKDRKESIADHSWRLALMAMLLENEPEFKDVNMNTVIRICLIHDLGEAFTGDIPAFNKTDKDTAAEETIYHQWISSFDEADRKEWQSLMDQYNTQSTREGQVCKALDKLEALISHNESDISTCRSSMICRKHTDRKTWLLIHISSLSEN